ncbi:hypothetical protein [Variovorax sp. HJSM1_2]|uniref:hypothetical protein n=1 Tax=Variovorax sp. HJSM1_2 TaxID=3366263 RepID=UPI003BCAA643
MKQHTSFFATLAMALCLVTLGVAPACAQTPPQGQPPAPPPEAYAACKGQNEGTTVTLAMPDGKKLSGICRKINGTLAATPAGGPPQR